MLFVISLYLSQSNQEFIKLIQMKPPSHPHYPQFLIPTLLPH